MTDSRTTASEEVKPRAIEPSNGGMSAEESETSLRTEGQRRINIVWEVTQSVVALLVTMATLFVAGKLALSDDGSQGAFLLLSNVFFLVLGTYFNRTNHIRVGGVGKGQRGR